MTYEEAVVYVRQVTALDEDELSKYILDTELEKFSYENGGIWGIHVDDAWVVSRRLLRRFNGTMVLE